MQEKWTYCLWGAAGGALALAIVGFSWGGWVTGGTAQKMARQEANAAVVKVLTPFCVANFQKAPDAVAKLASLKKIDLIVAARVVRQRAQVGADRKGAGQRRDRCVRSGALQALILPRLLGGLCYRALRRQVCRRDNSLRLQPCIALRPHQWSGCAVCSDVLDNFTSLRHKPPRDTPPQRGAAI